MKPSTATILLHGDAHTCPDIQYVTDFVAVDPVQLLIVKGCPNLLLPPLEVGRGLNETRGVTITSTTELAVTKSKRRSSLALTTAWLKAKKIRSLVVSPTFPIGIADGLRKEGVRVRVSTKPLFPERERKSKTEVEKIRVAQKAAVAAAKAAIELIRTAEISTRGLLRVEGKTLTSERVKETIHKTLIERQCFCDHVIVAGGAQGADPHDRGTGPLRANESIILDIFPRDMTTGYWGDLTRTVVRGSASPTLKRMNTAVRRAHGAALKMVKPGVLGSAVHKTAASSLSSAGFETGSQNGVPVGFFHGTGHGVGLEIHEAPSLSSVDVPLEVGHVITIEPGLYYPEHGGIRVEDTVVVTRKGYELLARCPKPFEL